MAYQSLVRPQLNYASTVWDPHSKDKTHIVEMVQRRAARWTLSDYVRTTSVTSLQSQLNWQILEERRSVARLCLFYKIVNGRVAMPLPDYMQSTHRISMYCHSMAFRQIHTSKDYYKYSFFPLAISDFICLPYFSGFPSGLKSHVLISHDFLSQSKFVPLPRDRAATCSRPASKHQKNFCFVSKQVRIYCIRSEGAI